ncbi:hypothetical protein THASP1DRAFT_27068 [Thamnocephalis sphaerospora]|uniref:Rad52/22 family double-strand break repair protein-domain-containing protein n=1 Tax=Thamnocephalis sphaerospora TaxID=78915 RepID=A0A4P9Y072_9FUNG|nr:hypothetical protein THASP1DRAFT_27068 [Thamnocephalis sphaerospora]|eukprot:RKP11150.1 hypothetical protein THASP1DRAFT_27068 [Thamnocephalis sphaerospora]
MSFGRGTFSAEEHDTLSRNLTRYLGPDCVASRAGQGGTKLHYIEGWKVLNLANDVWGFDGWSSSIVEVTVDYIDNVNGRISVGVSAIVRVTIKNGAHHEDIGFGMAENMKSKGMALEKAKKEAITDALKRALRGFGNVLGNCIYDKHYLRKVTRIPTAPAKDLDPSTFYHFKYDSGDRNPSPASGRRTGLAGGTASTALCQAQAQSANTVYAPVNRNDSAATFRPNPQTSMPLPVGKAAGDFLVQGDAVDSDDFYADDDDLFTKMVNQYEPDRVAAVGCSTIHETVTASFIDPDETTLEESMLSVYNSIAVSTESGSGSSGNENGKRPANEGESAAPNAPGRLSPRRSITRQR